MEEQLLYTIAANMAFSTFGSRFIQLSSLMAPLRRAVEERALLLHKLISCPHCLCFWLSLAGSAHLSHTALEAGCALLFGWRGGYHFNRLFDRLAGEDTAPKVSRQCRACDAPYERKFLERQGHYFCSYKCWFSHLKDQRRGERPVFDAEGLFTRQEVYPVSIKTINPTQAKELLDSDENYVYIDVRSMPEYEVAHPSGALNIPIMHKESMGMVPNGDFVRVVEKHFARDAKLLLGCQMGGRSQRAAEALVAAGFQDVSNVMGGFGGARDQSGNVVERGWAELGLPVEQGSSEGTDYPSLSQG